MLQAFPSDGVQLLVHGGARREQSRGITVAVQASDSGTLNIAPSQYPAYTEAPFDLGYSGYLGHFVNY